MYRPEHPNPQFARKTWQNLNGKWAFALDQTDNGIDKGYAAKDDFSDTIEVPFCPESSLSGIGHTDFIRACWYTRHVDIPKGALTGRVLLHFGAVDYEATVYIGGREVGRHKGGYTPFCIDVTDAVTPGDNLLTVRARDNTRDPMIPSGKQSERSNSYGCFYTRTTGIWQTVWLEFVPVAHIRSVRFTPDAANAAVTVTADVAGAGEFSVAVSYGGEPMAAAAVKAEGAPVTLTLPLAEAHLWEPGHGRLYDVTLIFGDDVVHSYFGLRDVRVDGRRVRINGKSVFQRLVLDQGFYPDGVYTAPDEAALARDIELSMAAGFNGARLHQKVFEPLFLYHADKAGYLCWGEYPNWGLDHTNIEAFFRFYKEWQEAVERDFNHPSIIGWCPFNETWDIGGRPQRNELLEAAYRMTKALDPTRPVIDVSGNYHVMTDIYDLHNYKQDPVLFREKLDKLKDGEVWDPNIPRRQPLPWDGKMPMFMSEYGGIRWSDKDGWGYGEAPKEKEEFLARYKALTEALLANPVIFGFCYTQLYDVEQEQNGLYTYERQPKFDMAFFKAVNTQLAAIED